MKKIIFGIFFFSLFSYGSSLSENSRYLIHLLTYIGNDYAGAVQNRTVVSPSEFEEQKEFSNTVIEIVNREDRFKSSEEIQKGIIKLKQLVAEKADSEAVRETAQSVQNEVFKISGLQQLPKERPDINHGKQLYSKQCAQCHGATGEGNGPSSGNMDPKPANFLDAKNDSKSPFQFFNAIRLGVPGTSMAAFNSLTESETWELAYYVDSLRSVPKEVAPLAIAKQNLNSSLAAYKAENFELAKTKAIAAYLDGVEPIEPKLRLNDPKFTVKLEEALAAYRKKIDRRVPVADLETNFREITNLFSEADKVLAAKPSSFWMTFSVAAGIFLREALEAALLLITLLGVVKTLGNPKARYFIHGGWISAFLVGVISWFFSGWVVKISGLRRELLEGSISLLAVGVLLYFGFWLHRKTEIGKWRSFINDLVKNALDNKKLAGLAVVAFMGVFREAFETVLFLRALLIECPGQDWALGFGVLIAFIFVLVASALAVKYSARLPLKQLFSFSSAMMVFLAFVLIGKSVHAFQEAGLISSTPISGMLRIDLLGLFPTAENLIPQTALILVTAFIWMKPKIEGLFKETTPVKS
jgi:high-affinity iron transporter